MGRRGRGGVVPKWLRVALVVMLAALPAALADTVTIDTNGDPDARLELRTVTLPDGTVQELYVVRAERITVRSGELTLTASRLEFDPSRNTVRIVGRGRVERPDEVLVGEDLRVHLGDGRLDGRDVWVLTDRVNVFGVQAERVDGRVRLVTSDIAPCARCGQSTEDYGFLAERVEILPGDRILAWDAIVLIRERPLLSLPLLVLPIAAPERLPRFALTRGTDATKASIELDWPYVAGPSAYGTLRARVRLDVDPATGSVLDGGLLGGRVEAVYPEGGFVHRFVDEAGSGLIDLDVRPAYEEEIRRRPTVRFEATYRSDDVVGRPRIDLRLARDDERRPDLLETDVRLEVDSVDRGDDPNASYLRFTVVHRNGIPLREDAVISPSWDGPAEARTVPLAFSFETAGRPLQAGALQLTTAGLELGAYDDQVNPANRSAVGRDRTALGRVEARARLDLSRVRLGPFEVDGFNDFLGRYYATAERQVDWEVRLQARLPLADVGSFTFSGVRDTAEGETPFAFDRLRLRTRSELRASLDLRPWAGTSLRAEAGYVLENDRAATERGWTPTRVRLTTLGTTRWADLALEHEADPNRGDVGTLRVEASVQVPSRRWVARLNGAVVTDLDPTLAPDRGISEVRDTGEGSATLTVGLQDRLVARADGGYDVEATVAEPFDWRPLRLSLTGGTLAAGDTIPGAEVFWEFDPDDGATQHAGYQAALDLGPLRLEAEQAFGAAGGERGTHRYALVWTGVARATAEGWELLPSAWLGLEPDPSLPRRVSVSLRDDRGDRRTRFSASYRSDIVTVGTETERRDSRFEATVRLAERTFAEGWIGVAVDGFADVAIADDVQATSYLRRASLEASLGLGNSIGLQGTVGYRSSYDPLASEVRSGRLSLQQVSLVVRATSELYLGATLDDVWEIVDVDPSSSLAFDPRPTLFVTWDRCCWALYSSWDTRTGEVELTIGAPGTAEGPQLAIGEGVGPTLPWPPGEQLPDEQGDSP